MKNILQLKCEGVVQHVFYLWLCLLSQLVQYTMMDWRCYYGVFKGEIDNLE